MAVRNGGSKKPANPTENRNMHNKSLGKEGERKARWYLRLHGWKIIEKNFKKVKHIMVHVNSAQTDE